MTFRQGGSLDTSGVSGGGRGGRCRIVATAESLEDDWSTRLPAEIGTRWVQPHTTNFTGAIDTGCGAASSDIGPFYCPADEDVHVDPAFFDRVLVRQLGGSPSGAAQMYVVAHEFGHHL